jgi:hypothetical protein
VPEVVTVVSPVKVPVGELPMLAPLVPDRVVGPVLVMPEPARTAKLFEVPSCTAGMAAVAKTVMKIVVAVIAAMLPAITVLVSFEEFLSAENNLCPLLDFATS